MNISINNQQLVLFAQTQIPSVSNHPFFSNDGSHSFEIEVPADENAHIFGLPQYPSSTYKKTTGLKAKIDLVTRAIDCFCKVSSANRKTISLLFYYEESNFYVAIKGKKLTDLPFDEEFSIEAPQVSTYDYRPEQGLFIEGNEFQFLNFPATGSFFINTNNHWKVLPDPQSPTYSYPFYVVDNPDIANPFVLKMTLKFDHSFVKQDGKVLSLVIRVYGSGPNPTSTIIADVSEMSNKLIYHEQTLSLGQKFRFMLAVTNEGSTNPFESVYPAPSWFCNHIQVNVWENHPDYIPMDPTHKKFSFFPAMYESLYSDDYDYPEMLNAGYCNFAELDGKMVWINKKDEELLAYVNLPVPSFFARYILNYVEKLTGFTILKPEGIDDFDNIVIPGFVSIFNIDYFNHPEGEIYRKTFSAKEMLPGYSISKFLEGIETATCTIMEVNDVAQTISFRRRQETLLSSNIIDATDDLVEMEFTEKEKPTGFRVSYKEHPDPFFATFYRSLDGLNILGTTSTNHADLAPGENIKDCWLIEGASRTTDGYWKWDGERWQFHSLNPPMEMLYRHDTDNVLDYEIMLHPLLSRLVNAPFSNTSLSCVIPRTRLPLYFINTITPNEQEAIPFCYSVYR
ncbi:MAG: hypothetical protein ACOCX0_06680, partial [Bacteroidota bacterium]